LAFNSCWCIISGGLFGVGLVGTNLFTKVAPFVNQICDLLNFELPFTEWPRLPNINSDTIRSYHEALKQVHLSDGSLLVKPMTGPDFDSLPPLNLRINDGKFVDNILFGSNNAGNPDNPPARYVGGFVFNFPGTKQNWFTDDFVGVTMQVMDRTRPEGYSLWTAIFPKGQLSLMSASRVTSMKNNAIQLNPFLDFQSGDEDTTWWDMKEFLRTEGWYDPLQNDQALRDFVAGIPNNYLDAHVVIASTGATRWIPPKK
jgi:hypothetical protein